MVNDTSALSEQTALVAHSSGDSPWLDRLLDDDPLPRLGDTFQLNSTSRGGCFRFAEQLDGDGDVMIFLVGVSTRLSALGGSRGDNPDPLGRQSFLPSAE